MKTLKLPNTGNRFLANHFLLITPEMPSVPESDLHKRFIIEDTLGTIPPFEAERVTIGRAELWRFSELFTWLTGADNPNQFYEDFLKNNPSATAKANVTLVVMKRVVPFTGTMVNLVQKTTAA